MPNRSTREHWVLAAVALTAAGLVVALLLTLGLDDEPLPARDPVVASVARRTKPPPAPPADAPTGAAPSSAAGQPGTPDAVLAAAAERNAPEPRSGEPADETADDPAAELLVRVLLDGADGVSGASVEVVPDDVVIEPLEAETDATGECVLEVPPGVGLWVRASRGERSTAAAARVAALEPVERGELTLVLRSRPRLWFHGRVVREEDGEPLPDATVRLASDPEERVRATTDPGGVFGIQVDHGPREAIVSAPGRPAVRVAVVPRHESAFDAVRVDVPRYAELVVRLVPDEATPVDPREVEVAIVLEPDTEGRSASTAGVALLVGEAPRASERTEPDRVVFPHVLPRRAGEVTLTHRGEVLWQSASSGFAAGETIELERTVGRRVRVAGTLVDDARDEPLAHREVWLCRRSLVPPVDEKDYFRADARPARSVRTDDEGRFVLEGVPEGPWWIGAAPGMHVAPKARLVHLEKDVDRLVVRAARGISIRGSVLDADGRPVPGTVVSIGHPDEAAITTRVEDDGSFVLLPVAWERITIVATPPRRSGWVRKWALVSANDRDVRIELCPAARLSGRVLDERGAPLDGRVWIAGSADDDSPRWFDGTAAGTEVEDGVFLFEEIPATTWDVFFRTPDGLFARLAGHDVPDAGPDVGELVARPGGEVEIVPREGWVHAPSWVVWRDLPVGEGVGRSVLSVPDGDLAVVDWLHREEPIRVAAGERTRYEL
jgi:hypothetical protein